VRCHLYRPATETAARALAVDATTGGDER
jgi:hypothetical protein